MRLRAHLNSEVKVLDLASTLGPVAERNCIGAIPPGGEQQEAKDQSVTRGPPEGLQCELDSVRGFDEPDGRGRSPNKIVPSAWREWKASDGEPRMVGDRMVGSLGDVNQGTTVGGQLESIGVRALVVAEKRVTTVERRSTGQ